MYKTVIYQLATTKEQNALLEGQSRIANKVYNKLLTEVLAERQYYEVHKSKENFNIFSKYDLRNQVPKLKDKYPVLKTLFSSCAKNVAFSLHEAIMAWHNRTAGTYVGFPKHRSYKEKGFLTLIYEDPFTGYDIIEGKLKLSFGMTIDEEGKNHHHSTLISFKKKLKLNKEQIKILKICYNSYTKSYEAHFSILIEDPELVPVKSLIALDPNHKNLMVGKDNNGNVVEFFNFHKVKETDKRIERVTKKQKKCKLGSRRSKYLQSIKQKLWKKRQAQIEVCFQTIANYLCREYDLIGIGDYVAKAKQFKKMNKAMINQSNFGLLRSILERTCLRTGKTYVKYNEHHTTIDCSVCFKQTGPRNDPTVREWDCTSCKTHHNRDENSAQNGIYRLDKFHMLPCSGYLSVKERYTCRFTGGKLLLLKRALTSVKAVKGRQGIPQPSVEADLKGSGNLDRNV